MAGILANSVSKTMEPGDTSVDNTTSGFLTLESIVLSTSPGGAAYSWGLAKPEGSTARCALSDATAAAPTMTPDIAGDYVITVTVDSTTSYVLRANVTQTAITTAYEAIRLSPKSDASVPTPIVGCALYWSEDQSALAVKDSAGVVSTVDLTPV